MPALLRRFNQVYRVFEGPGLLAEESLVLPGYLPVGAEQALHAACVPGPEGTQARKDPAPGHMVRVC